MLILDLSSELLMLNAKVSDEVEIVDDEGSGESWIVLIMMMRLKVDEDEWWRYYRFKWESDEDKDVRLKSLSDSRVFLMNYLRVPVMNEWRVIYW